MTDQIPSEGPLRDLYMTSEMTAEQFNEVINSVRAEGFLIAQQTIQETVGEAMRDYVERVLKNRAKLMEEFGL